MGMHCDYLSDDSDEDEPVEPTLAASDARRWVEVPTVDSPTARAISRRLLGLRRWHDTGSTNMRGASSDAGYTL